MAAALSCSAALLLALAASASCSRAEPRPQPAMPATAAATAQAEPSASALTDPLETLSYLTEDYPPSNYLDRGVLKGTAVELLKAAWKAAGVREQPIEVLPWARAYDRALKDPNVVLFAMTRNPPREHLFRWAGPISRGRYVLAKLASATFPGLDFEAAKKYRVGALRDDIGQSTLVSAGFPDESIDLSSTMGTVFQKLMSGRIDLMCVYETSIPQLEYDLGIAAGTIVPACTVSENVVWYALSLATPAATAERLQGALRAVEAERIRIDKEYGQLP